MDKFLQFGRKAWFLVRVLSGYEERRIRSYRLQLQKRIEQAQARKTELRRIPEQAILSEVRRMVEEMQALNRQLEETEAAIEDYFKPLDKNAEILMNMQLEKEQEQMKVMMKAMQEQANLHRDMAMKNIKAAGLETSPSSQNNESASHSNQEQDRKT
ncbi:uncharacterized protein [Typha angustifolia]|uniref:uncharacterized protein n=1 Tax=Typha angustifolia TaxID=59011 RepID=UPI003C2B5217